MHGARWPRAACRSLCGGDPPRGIVLMP
jgi:hypothetical protein